MKKFLVFCAGAALLMFIIFRPDQASGLVTDVFGGGIRFFQGLLEGGVQIANSF